MNQKGFTLIELLTVIAIIAIIAGVIFSQSKDAFGMQLNTPMPATDAVIEEVIIAIADDPDQTVTILIYSADFSVSDEGFTNLTNLMAEQKRVLEKMIKSGVSGYKLNIAITNKGGMEYKGTIAPPMDGVYIFLE